MVRHAQEVRRRKPLWVVVLWGGIQRTQMKEGPSLGRIWQNKRRGKSWDKMHKKCLGTRDRRRFGPLFFLPSFLEDLVIQPGHGFPTAEFARDIRGKETLGAGMWRPQNWVKLHVMFICPAVWERLWEEGKSSPLKISRLQL